MTGWTASAYLLADAIREPGFACAALNAAAWAAGVNPQATGGLVGAALALTDGQAGAALWDAGKPCESDRALLEAAAELEGAVAELLSHATRAARDCRAAWQAACEQAERAAAGLTAESPQARAAAQAALDAARPVIADCEAALEVTDGCGARLAHAANCLRKLPDDLASTYEQPYSHVRDGGTLPYSGDFLGGTADTGAGRAAPAEPDPDPGEDSFRARERRWRHDFDLTAVRLADLGALTETGRGDHRRIAVDEAAVPGGERYLVRDFWALWDEGVRNGFLEGDERATAA